MNFSARIKDELARIYPSKRCCRLAELSAILHLDGAFHIQGAQKYAFHTKSENAAVARKTYRFLTSLFSVNAEVLVGKSEKLKKNNEYVIFIPTQEVLTQVMNETGVLDDQLRLCYKILPRLVKKNCCALAYLRGAFLGGGAISNPRRSYHCELVSSSEELSYDLQKLMNRFGLGAKVSKKQKNFTVYLKESDRIAKFMALIGAHHALLQWEDVKIVKEIRNQVNRLVNCDTANLNKTVEAAQAQIRDIKIIDEAWGLINLPGSLQEMAEIRLRYPEVNMRELGELCTPPLSKSAVFHRLRKIHRLAKSLRIKV